jgi:alkylation response protein AidB-like acyl-CoA dehydrogenase
MDFDDAPEDAAFRVSVRAWLTENFRALTDAPPDPFYNRGEESLEEARAAQARLLSAGLAGITWPKEFGGRGGTLSQEIIFREEAARFDIPTSVFLVGLALAGPTIIAHGSSAQKARYLRPILGGEEIWCQLFSEPDAGSDLASMRTKAVLNGGGWVVNGQKIWSSGAHYADFGIMPARTDPAKAKHRGITYFLIDMRAPGVTVRPLRQMTGDAHFNEVFLDEVHVPADNVLGEVNGGWAVTQTTLMNERTLGAGELSFEPAQLVAFARGVTIDGRPATDHPLVRQSLIELYTRSEILRFIRYRLLTALTQGRLPGPEGSVAKLAATQLLNRAADLALALQGPGGGLVGDEAPAGGAWQKLFLSNPALRIAGGTDEIQRNIISERVLGLPREHDPWRERPFAEQPGASSS